MGEWNYTTNNIANLSNFIVAKWEKIRVLTFVFSADEIIAFFANYGISVIDTSKMADWNSTANVFNLNTLIIATMSRLGGRVRNIYLTKK